MKRGSIRREKIFTKKERWKMREKLSQKVKCIIKGRKKTKTVIRSK